MPVDVGRIMTPSWWRRCGETCLSTAYSRSPVWLQNIALGIYGVGIRRRRYGGHFWRCLDEAQEAEKTSREEIRRIQEERWRESIQPVVSRLAGYGRRTIPLTELGGLPVLTKEQVREHLGDYLHRCPRGVKVLRSHTAGTTGTGFQFFTTTYTVQRQWAFWWRYRKWLGIPFGEPCAVFAGRIIVPLKVRKAPFWRVNRPGHAVLFSQYHLSPERAPLYLAEIRRRGLRWLHGYPSVLALLAHGGLAAGLAGSVPVRWITIGGESLVPAQRRLIKEMFGVAPREHYGLAEGVANISECPEGRLHVDEDFSLVEFLPRVDGGEGHRIVGTTLDNEAMPFLRYDTGDVALLPGEAESPCSCGRPGRLVSEIDGRKDDYLVLSDGSLVGRVGFIYQDAVNVAEAQVIQEKIGEAILRVVRGPRYTTRDEEGILQQVEKRFGDRLQVSFDYVERVPRSANGKVRLMVNELSAGRLGNEEG